MNNVQKLYGSSLQHFNIMKGTLEEIKKKNKIRSFHDGHSTISDGGLDLLRQINHRIAEGFDGMTMTDHNTLQSVKEAQKIITEKKLNFTIANGIEISLGGEYPGHLIMMDFDLEEFDNIFYEKYLSQELITAKKSNSINNFQPSRNRTIIDTKEVFGIINQMKQNPVYEYVIFPGDSFDRISRILLFHYEKGNIKKFPIFQIPHPALGESGFMKYAIQKTLTNQGLTNYGTILNNEDAYKYYIEEFKHIIETMKKLGGEETIICYEKITQSIGTTKEHSLENKFIKELGCIPNIGSDMHLLENNNLGVAIDKNITIREYLLDKKNKQGLIDIVDLSKFQKSEEKNIIKDTINKILFLLRWTIDPIVNEYINLNMSHTYVDSKEFKNRAKQFEINETSQTKKMLRRVSQALDDIFYKSI